jgi:hypothetical protein
LFSRQKGEKEYTLLRWQQFGLESKLTKTYSKLCFRKVCSYLVDLSYTTASVYESLVSRFGPWEHFLIHTDALTFGIATLSRGAGAQWPQGEGRLKVRKICDLIGMMSGKWQFTFFSINVISRKNSICQYLRLPSAIWTPEFLNCVIFRRWLLEYIWKQIIFTAYSSDPIRVLFGGEVACNVLKGLSQHMFRGSLALM